MQRTFIPRFAELHFGLIHFYEEANVEHSELVRCLAKPGSEILKSLSAADCDLWHMGTGVVTEAGELLDAVKKIVIYRRPPDRENVVEELGDLEFYMEGLRQRCGITREETIEHNIRKLEKRYASLSYSDQAAQARADKDE